MRSKKIASFRTGKFIRRPPMRDWQSQAHERHFCRHHVVFVPKYRRKAIYGTLRKEIGGIFRELCRQGGMELVEGYAMRDYIHMLLMNPPNTTRSAGGI
jgi:putative transposase